jgi:hypothetical protein
MSIWRRLQEKLDAGTLTGALEKGDPSAVRAILERSGAGPNSTVLGYNGIVEDGTTVLMFAVGFGHAGCIPWRARSRTSASP